MLRTRTTFSFFFRSHGYCSTNLRPLFGSTALSGTAVALVAPQAAPALTAAVSVGSGDVVHAPDISVALSIAPASRLVVRVMTFSPKYCPAFFGCLAPTSTD